MVRPAAELNRLASLQAQPSSHMARQPNNQVNQAGHQIANKEVAGRPASQPDNQASAPAQSYYSFNTSKIAARPNADGRTAWCAEAMQIRWAMSCKQDNNPYDGAKIQTWGANRELLTPTGATRNGLGSSQPTRLSSPASHKMPTGLPEAALPGCRTQGDKCLRTSSARGNNISNALRGLIGHLAKHNVQVVRGDHLTYKLMFVSRTRSYVLCQLCRGHLYNKCISFIEEFLS